MHFLILHCHAFMHCWKDSSGMPLSSVIMALLIASTPSKWVPLMIPLSWGKEKNLMEQNQLNKEVVLVWWCSSHSRPARCTVSLLFRHAQISGDNILNPVLSHIQLTCYHCQSTIATHHLPYPLDVDLNPACWKPPDPKVIFYLIETQFEPLVPLKKNKKKKKKKNGHNVMFISIHLQLNKNSQVY